MAITLLKIGNSYFSPDRKEFLIDDVDDVDGLPTSTKDGTDINGRCSPGSIAYTADLALRFMLGNDDEWHEIRSRTG